MNTATPTRIAVTPGDGIGPEVIHQSLRVLEHLRNQYGLVLEWDQLEWPSTDWHRRNDRMMPEDAMGQLAAYDAILLGALGDPGPSRDPNRYLLSDSVSLSPLLEMRKGFDQWVCERPARQLPGARQYLADPRAADTDMLVIRENSEGEYVGRAGGCARASPAKSPPRPRYLPVLAPSASSVTPSTGRRNGRRNGARQTRSAASRPWTARRTKARSASSPSATPCAIGATCTPGFCGSREGLPGRGHHPRADRCGLHEVRPGALAVRCSRGEQPPG